MQVKLCIFLSLLVGVQTFSFGEILGSDSSDSIEPSDQHTIEEKEKAALTDKEEKMIGHILNGDGDQEDLSAGEILGSWQEGLTNHTTSNRKVIEIR